MRCHNGTVPSGNVHVFNFVSSNIILMQPNIAQKSELYVLLLLSLVFFESDKNVIPIISIVSLLNRIEILILVPSHFLLSLRT